MRRFLLVLGCLAVLCPAASAQPAPAVRVTEYGEYVVRRALGQAEQQPGQDTLSPVQTVEEPQFVNHTRRIEARLCLRFGIQFDVPGARPGTALTFTVRVTHPTMTLPDGRSGQTETWATTIGDQPGLAGFGFDNEWELLPGSWNFAILQNGQVLAQQDFDVVLAPNPAARSAAGCNAPIA